MEFRQKYNGAPAPSPKNPPSFAETFSKSAMIEGFSEKTEGVRVCANCFFTCEFR